MASAERKSGVRWLEVDRGKLRATVVAMPDRDDFANLVPGAEGGDKRLIREEMVVELYSK
jgi:ribosomal protein S4